MTFSLIGTGFIFPSHVEAIRHVGGKIRDVVNAAHNEDAWREMVQTTDAECVVILTPNDLHVPMVRAAAARGKIVLCEKPLALSTSELKSLLPYKHIFTVLQLRHHPLVQKLRNEISPHASYEIEIDISVYRDSSYYQSWKGDARRSGGILFNLGSHYFDLLIHLFGEPSDVEGVAGNDTTVEGVLRGPRYKCRWRVSTEAERAAQCRTFTVSGVPYNFSSKDNLSYENLHRSVYEQLKERTGITPAEVLPVTSLIERIYERL